MISFNNIRKSLTSGKIAILVVIVLFLIIIIIESINIFSKQAEDKKIEETNPNTTFFSDDGIISLEIAKKYELSQFHSNERYLLELRSSRNLDIFFSHRNLIEDKNLSEVVAADKRAFLEGFQSTANISEQQNIKVINDFPAFTYSFEYLDKNQNKAYYLQVIWIETDNGYYVIDVEIPMEYLSYYSTIITDITSGFRIKK